MNKLILGSSSVTEYQLTKYSELNKVYQPEILAWYIQYALEYEIQVDVAYAMALIYTDYFRKPILGNNICGIGENDNGTGLETFGSIERCIIAQYQIMKKCAILGWEPEEPISNTVNYIESGINKTSDSMYRFFKYYNTTEYTLSNWHLILQEINRTRKEKVNWTTSDDKYYYVKVKSSTKRSEIIRLKSELINKGFEESNVFIMAKNGLYILEVGRCTSPMMCLTILQNLRVYNYSGETLYRITSTGEEIIV